MIDANLSVEDLIIGETYPVSNCEGTFKRGWQYEFACLSEDGTTYFHGRSGSALFNASDMMYKSITKSIPWERDTFPSTVTKVRHKLSGEYFYVQRSSFLDSRCYVCLDDGDGPVMVSYKNLLELYDNVTETLSVCGTESS